MFIMHMLDVFVRMLVERNRACVTQKSTNEMKSYIINQYS